MNRALIIRWRAALVELLQNEELTEQEGIAAMREIDRLDESDEVSGEKIKIVEGRAA